LRSAVTYSMHILAHLAKQSKDLLCKKLKKPYNVEKQVFFAGENLSV
jgi:DNA-binding IscR family transcriptional regulator